MPTDWFLLRNTYIFQMCSLQIQTPHCPCPHIDMSLLIQIYSYKTSYLH